MATYVDSGGSGSGTATATNAAHVVITVLTTPATANIMYIIQITFGNSVGGAAVASVPLGSISTGGTFVCGGGKGSIFKVGPSTAVKINFSNRSGTSGDVGYAYNYVAIVMDTN